MSSVDIPITSCASIPGMTLRTTDDPLEEARRRGRAEWKRPTSAVDINPRGAVAKLGALGFDPIEQMVKKYDEIQTIIDQIIMSPKPSMIALGQMMGVQQRISEKLMSYGYVQVEKLPDERPTEEPVMIILSDEASGDEREELDAIRDESGDCHEHGSGERNSDGEHHPDLSAVDPGGAEMVPHRRETPSGSTGEVEASEAPVRTPMGGTSVIVETSGESLL